MSHPKNVQRLYALFNARWYDSFREKWMKKVSIKAEKEFTRRLREKVKLTSNILELGCGTGINIGRIKDLNFKSYTCLDFSHSMLEIAQQKYGKMKHISFIERDITKFNQRENKEKYDLIISTWVLSHLENPARIINQYSELLNKSGNMLLIFLTKPVWYINFWLYPFTRLFACKYVTEQEIAKINGRKIIHKSGLNLVTLMEIKK